MRVSIRSLLASTSVVLAMSMAAPATALASSGPDSVSSACGTPLSSSEIDSVVSLSDTSTLPDSSDLARFDEEVDRIGQIKKILVRHHDRRGILLVGIDIVDRKGLVPLQHDPNGFANPEFGHAYTPELLGRFLSNLHRHFLGKSTEEQWTRFYDLAEDCDKSPVQATMAGYNAHLGVDVAHALEAVRARLGNAGDYLKITAAVVAQGDAIKDATKSEYGVDLGLIWPVMLTASPGICTIAFVNGVASQSPLLRGVIQAEIELLWRTTDFALVLLT